MIWIMSLLYFIFGVYNFGYKKIIALALTSMVCYYSFVIVQSTNLLCFFYVITLLLIAVFFIANKKIEQYYISYVSVPCWFLLVAVVKTVFFT